MIDLKPRQNCVDHHFHLCALFVLPINKFYMVFGGKQDRLAKNQKKKKKTLSAEPVELAFSNSGTWW